MAGARRTSRRRYILLVIVLTAITLITLDTRNGRSGPLGVLGRGAHTVVAPVQSAVSSVARPIGDWLEGVTDSGKIKSENRNLKGQVQRLEGTERSAHWAGPLTPSFLLSRGQSTTWPARSATGGTG